MTKRPALNVVAFDWSSQVISYAWRFCAARTDFYLVPRYAPLSGAKISLHGPNETHETLFYKYGINRDGINRAIRAGGVTNAPFRGLEFEGRFIEPGVRHVITLRWTPGLFKAGRPPAPNPGELSPASLGHIVPRAGARLRSRPRFLRGPRASLLAERVPCPPGTGLPWSAP